MKKNEFYNILMDTLEIESVNSIDSSTPLISLEEYDSLAVLSLIAMIDEHFDKRIPGTDFLKITTIQSLMDLIGTDQFE